MYEKHHQPLISVRQFAMRMLSHTLLAVLVIVGSVLLGMVGFVVFGKATWTDAFLHSAMLLAGMGLVEKPELWHHKLFVGFFALYTGIVFVAVSGLILAPVAHRIMHLFHLKEDDDIS